MKIGDSIKVPANEYRLRDRHLRKGTVYAMTDKVVVVQFPHYKEAFRYDELRGYKMSQSALRDVTRLKFQDVL